MPPFDIRDVGARRFRCDPTATIDASAHIGAPGESRDKVSSFDAVVDACATIRECVRVQAGTERETFIGKRTLLMAGSHVGHDAVIGMDCEIAPNVVIGGHADVGNAVRVGLGAVVLPFKRIGDGARIGAGAVVTKHVPAGEVWAGNPARLMSQRVT